MLHNLLLNAADPAKIRLITAQREEKKMFKTVEKRKENGASSFIPFLRTKHNEEIIMLVSLSFFKGGKEANDDNNNDYQKRTFWQVQMYGKHLFPI